jgi:alkaline phosphatase D
MDHRRTLLGAEQERWLADGWTADRPWNLLAQQTLMARFSWEEPNAGNQGGQYRTDGWDGYPAARRRLLQTVADKRVPGVVVLGGDVHANCVADLKADFDNARSPVIASEFCGTSITSLGLDNARVAAAKAFNPHIHFARSDQRGYQRFKLTPQALQADLMVLDNARDAGSAIRVGARYAVEAARPGIQLG